MVSYNPLYFCIVCCNFLFISDFVVLILLFFLMSLDKGLSILFIFSKSHLLVLLIFTIVSFISFSFIFALIFRISFLLILVFFCCCSSSSLSSCFRCKIRLFIQCFSYFLRWDCIAINFPLRTAFVASYRS